MTALSDTAQKIFASIIGLFLATIIGVLTHQRDIIDQLRNDYTELCADYRRHISTEHGDSFLIQCRK